MSEGPHKIDYPAGTYDMVLASSSREQKRLIGTIFVTDGGSWWVGFAVEHGVERIKTSSLDHAIGKYNDIQEAPYWDQSQVEKPHAE